VSPKTCREVNPRRRENFKSINKNINSLKLGDWDDDQLTWASKHVCIFVKSQSFREKFVGVACIMMRPQECLSLYIIKW
jgi:hypothetical protein